MRRGGLSHSEGFVGPKYKAPDQNLLPVVPLLGKSHPRGQSSAKRFEMFRLGPLSTYASARFHRRRLPSERRGPGQCFLVRGQCNYLGIRPRPDCSAAATAIFFQRGSFFNRDFSFIFTTQRLQGNAMISAAPNSVAF